MGDWIKSTTETILAEQRELQINAIKLYIEAYLKRTGFIILPIENGLPNICKRKGAYRFKSINDNAIAYFMRRKELAGKTAEQIKKAIDLHIQEKSGEDDPCSWDYEDCY